MINNKHFKNESGLGLVELLIVIALLGLVLAIGYNFFFFGYRVYERGETLSIIQNNSRMAATEITRTVRNSTEIGVYDDLTGVDNSESIIYLDNSSRTIKHKVDDDVVFSTEPYVNNLQFKLIETNNRYILDIVINAEKDGRQHELVTKVLLNNIEASDIDDGSENLGDEGTVIRFTRP